VGAQPSAACNLRPPMRRVAAFLLLCASVLVLAGCGDKQAVETEGQEGVTLDVGGLEYQVQLSRFLNPNDVEDAYYLRGLPETTDLDPGRDSVWFAIFMRVKNPSDETLTPTTQFMISDTEGNKFQPVPIDEKQNPFVFQPQPLEHAHVLPDPDTPPGSGPIQGSLILFRIDTDALQNRPLTLHIQGNGEEEATMELDL
jgi:hypothetical protein